MPIMNDRDKPITAENAEEIFRENCAGNLEVIKKKMGWSQKQLAEKAGVSQAMMSDYVHMARLPSLLAISQLVWNTEIQRRIPFTIEQFLTRDIQNVDVDSGSGYVWDPEGGVHKKILGTYNLYFFDRDTQKTEADMQTREFRHGILSLYETVKKSGGVIVFAFARFFKSAAEANAFRGELDHIDAPGEDRQDKEILLYRSFDDTYIGSVSLVGEYVFVKLVNGFCSDEGLIILRAPEKMPGAEYIGGLGSNTFISQGAERVPISQKIILSRGIVEASPEEIASHLLFRKAQIEVEGELKALLDLLESLYDPEKNAAVDKILDKADKRAIIRQRLQQLINNHIDGSYNGLCMVSEQNDHACCQFLRRHVKE